MADGGVVIDGELMFKRLERFHENFLTHRESEWGGVCVCGMSGCAAVKVLGGLSCRLISKISRLKKKYKSAKKSVLEGPQ